MSALDRPVRVPPHTWDGGSGVEVRPSVVLAALDWEQREALGRRVIASGIFDLDYDLGVVEDQVRRVVDAITKAA